MEVMDVLRSPVLASIVNDLRTVREIQKVNAWNIFNLSSYNNQLENFHSDIIASLLDPKGLHGEGDKFLMLFIEYLNKRHQCSIRKDNYRTSRVPREKGRIDVGIFDESSLHCIIIENKINNAADQNLQIERYIDYARTYDFVVDAVVYLTLDGLKQAPNIEGDRSIVKTIAAYGQVNNLVEGWLAMCIDQSSTPGASSFIFQYIKLIKQLANHTMEDKVKQQFYDFVSQPENRHAVKDIMNLYHSLTDYRRDQFKRMVTDFHPFRRVGYYQYGENRDCFFEQYNLDGCALKFDIWFISDGSAKLYFWVPNMEESEPQRGFDMMTKVLTTVNMKEQFIIDGYKYIKYYDVTKHDDNIESVDIAVLAFARHFIGKLQEMQNLNP